MRPVRNSVTTQTTGSIIVLDHYTNPNNCALQVKFAGAGSATAKVEHTFDDVFDPAFNPATATWTQHPILNGLTANADGYYSPQPMACRLNVTALTAPQTVTLIVIPGGLGGV